MNSTPSFFPRSSSSPLPKWSTMRAAKVTVLFALAAAMTFPASLDAGTATFSTTAPAIGADDISQLTGHVTSGSTTVQKRSNVGGGDDNATYLANDRPVQGQTFRTGPNVNGYQLLAVTLRQVTHNTFSLIPDLNYTIRITSPSTNTLTVIAQETAFVPFDAADNFPTINGGNSAGAGSGNFVTFTLDSPVVLNPNTTYGFDVGGGAFGHYWEADGRSCTPSGPNCNALDPYANGTAYSTGANGSGSLAMTNRTGDRVFIVKLLPANVVVPPTITIQPKSAALYAGRTAEFAAKASGSPVLAYQWKKNGTNLNNGGNISGALTDTLLISNVSVADAGNYSLQVSNGGGSTNSITASLSVVTAPVAGTNYAYAIFTNNATAHWRLNETGDPSTNPPAYDYMGGRVGTYEIASQNGFNAVAGPRPSAFPGFEANNFGAESIASGDLSWVTVPGLNLNTNTVTLSAWIFPSGIQPHDAGVFWTRSGGTVAGIGYGGGGAGSAGELSYTWNNGTTWSFVSGLTIPSDQWSFIAVVIEPTKATLYLGTGGSLTNSVNSIPHTVEAWTGIGRIGSDPNGSLERIFNGVIDEVAAFKRSLTFDEINNLYGIGRGVIQAQPPAIGTQPSSQALYAGRTARFKAVASGSAPLSYQWRKHGTNLNNGGNVSGATTDSLTVANVSAANEGPYTLLASNPAGSITSAPASLTIALPTGKAYEAAVRTANPLAYWRLGETGDPSSGTLPAFEYWNGFTGTYGPATQPGVVGPRPVDFAQFESTNNAVQTSANGSTPSWVTLPAIHLNTNTVTITAWIYPNTTHIDYNGLLTTRNGSTEAAGIHYTLDNQIGYTWNGGNQETWSFMSELRPPLLQWSFVSLVIEPTGATLYLFNSTGLFSTNNLLPHTSEAWDGRAQLGGDQELAGWRIFDGTIDEVAIFNYAFTPAQVLNLYNSAFNAPAPQPRITNVAQIGSNLVFSGTNGVQGNSYVVLRTTNVALSPTNWTRIQTNTFGAGGTFTVTDAIAPGSAQSYYLLQLQ